jgi:hypothetical protein
MKGPNPFAAWESDPGAICGRKEEIRVFGSFANAAASGQAGAMLVTGGPGTGKTALLRHFRHEAEKAGMLAPMVNVERGEDERAVSDKIFHEISLMREKAAEGNPPSGFGRLAEHIGKLGGRGFGAVVFIDDIDGMKKADAGVAAIISIVKKSWGKRGAAFVMSSTRDIPAESEVLSKINLGPLSEHDARELVERGLKKGPPKMGEECLHSIIGDTGGNPRLLKTVCFNIYERLRENEKVISKGHYLAYLPQIMSALSREWFGRLYQETPLSERTILHALAREEDGMHVSDIAKKIRKPLGPVTALTRRLLDRGQIVRVGRGKYRVFSRLYGRYAAQRR